MTTEDRQETRQMLEDVLKGHSSEIIGRLNVLNANLIRVEGVANDTRKEAAKTNGKVAEHEKEIAKLKEANLVHVINCPNTYKLTELSSKIDNEDAGHEAQIKTKKMIWRYVTITATATAGVVMFIIKLWDFINNLKT